MIIAQTSYGIELAEAITETARLLGFYRTGKDVSGHIDLVIRELLKEGWLLDEGGHLRVTEDAAQEFCLDEIHHEEHAEQSNGAVDKANSPEIDRPEPTRGSLDGQSSGVNPVSPA